MLIKKEHLKEILNKIESLPVEQRFQALQVVMGITGYQLNINLGLNGKPLSISENISELNVIIENHIKDNSEPYPRFKKKNKNVPDCIEVTLLHGKPMFNQKRVA